MTLIQQDPRSDTILDDRVANNNHYNCACVHTNMLHARHTCNTTIVYVYILIFSHTTLTKRDITVNSRT